jgi:electron transfer flavoprotein beta subunit
MTHIIVCVKIVMDPEMPFSVFKVDADSKKPVFPEGTAAVISYFDESALEAALRIKDHQDCRITVLSLGADLPKSLMQKLYALGADDVVGVEAPEFDHLDPFTTAAALTRAIAKIGDFDLVFMGRQSADWESGLVWAGVAEALNLPSVSLVRQATPGNGQVTAIRCVSDGIEVLEVDLPALLTFTNEVGELRFTSLKDMMKAKKKNIVKWSAADIGFESAGRMNLTKFFVPEMPVVNCQIIEGDNDEDKGRRLARTLSDRGLV